MSAPAFSATALSDPTPSDPRPGAALPAVPAAARGGRGLVPPPRLIQGGMGVGVSGWRLARDVARLGHLGVVSGTGIDTVLCRRLQDGDRDGAMRRALARFPDRDVARAVLDRWFLAGGRAPGAPYRRVPLPSLRPSAFAQQSAVAAAFCEVWLAREGHGGPVGINLLEKLQTSNLPVLYGAMLAGVDAVLMGAGIPREIPGVLDALAGHRSASLAVPLLGAAPGAEARARLDPPSLLPGLDRAPLARPAFLAIVSSATLAAWLVRRATGRIDGLVVEGPTAGGHNAPPRGPLRVDARGEPVYGERDAVDAGAIRALGLPFWLAGGYGSPEGLARALALGAAGVQVGTAFAFCRQSGLDPELRRAALRRFSGGEPPRVRTDPLASPTGFPFKVVPMPGTLSEPDRYACRPRRCDVGYLRQAAVGPGGHVVYRCPAEPAADHERKGGRAGDEHGRKCLCNALLANIGLGQLRPGGARELPLLTAGDDLVHLARLSPGGRDYDAADVVRHLLGTHARADASAGAGAGADASADAGASASAGAGASAAAAAGAGG